MLAWIATIVGCFLLVISVPVCFKRKDKNSAEEKKQKGQQKQQERGGKASNSSTERQSKGSDSSLGETLGELQKTQGTAEGSMSTQKLHSEAETQLENSGTKCDPEKEKGGKNTKKKNNKKSSKEKSYGESEECLIKSNWTETLPWDVEGNPRNPGEKPASPPAGGGFEMKPTATEGKASLAKEQPPKALEPVRDLSNEKTAVIAPLKQAEATKGHPPPPLTKPGVTIPPQTGPLKPPGVADPPPTTVGTIKRPLLTKPGAVAAPPKPSGEAVLPKAVLPATKPPGVAIRPPAGHPKPPGVAAVPSTTKPPAAAGAAQPTTKPPPPSAPPAKLTAPLAGKAAPSLAGPPPQAKASP